MDASIYFDEPHYSWVVKIWNGVEAQADSVLADLIDKNGSEFSHAITISIDKYDAFAWCFNKKDATKLLKYVRKN